MTANILYALPILLTAGCLVMPLLIWLAKHRSKSENRLCMFCRHNAAHHYVIPMDGYLHWADERSVGVGSVCTYDTWGLWAEHQMANLPHTLSASSDARNRRYQQARSHYARTYTYPNDVLGQAWHWASSILRRRQTPKSIPNTNDLWSGIKKEHRRQGSRIYTRTRTGHTIYESQYRFRYGRLLPRWMQRGYFAPRWGDEIWDVPNHLVPQPTQDNKEVSE